MKKKYLYACCSILLLGVSVNAQNFPDGYKHYEGTINPDISLILDLVVAGNRAEGVYTYRKDNAMKEYKTIQIAGRWDVVSRSMTLKEYSSAEGSAFEFSMVHGKPDQLEGQWQPTGHEVSLACHVNESYPEGTIRFKTHSKALSYTLFPMMKESPKASYRIVCVEALGGGGLAVSDSVNVWMKRLFFGSEKTTLDFASAIEQESQRYFEHYADQNQDNYTMADKSSTFCWDKHLTINITHNAQQILSFIVKQYAFTGSGKGMTVRKTLCLRSETGKRLLLNDFIPLESDRIKLEEIINQEVRVKYDLGSSVPLTEKGFFADRLPLTENFALTSDQIIFFYNPYEVANATVGSIEISLPVSAIEGFRLWKVK